MTWKPLNTIDQLHSIYKSEEVSILFKHSTRCPVSAMAKRSLEYDKDLLPKDTIIYYLDLIAYRDISNTIAEMWEVKHESPQLLIIQGERCLYNASHSDIEMRDVIPFIS